MFKSGVAILLTSCSNITPLTTVSSQQVRSQKVASNQIQNNAIPSKKTSSISVDWQNVEAIADKFYQNASIPQSNSSQKQNAPAEGSFIEKSYAKSFGVSISEASRRLTLQAIGGALMEAIQQDLGDNFVEGYYINEDPNEFKVGITTLDTVTAERYIYQFKNAGLHSGSESLTLPIYIYPISNKTLGQINQLIADATPEILKRYPYMWMNHYDPVKNTVDIFISFHPSKLPNETERQRIEAELTNLIGHQVALEVNIATYSYRK